MSNVHPTAIIDPTAVIHAGAAIGAYCVIGPNVSIGRGTTLHNQVTVQRDTTIGEDNVVYPFAVIGIDPQDRKFRGEVTTVVIGDGNTIREHVTIHRGTANGGGETRIGNNNLLMVAVHIAHDCWIGDECTIANQAMLAGHIRVEDGANIGGGVGIHHFATIGTCAFVGAMARIPKDVPPFMLVEGNPAEVRATNVIGMMRRGLTADHIEAIKDAHKRLYRDNGAPMAEKLVELKRRYPQVPAVIHLCDALAASASGVHGRSMEVRRPDNKRDNPNGDAG
jgi:UDP-N-acetylglucosamine acyltransferase